MFLELRSTGRFEMSSFQGLSGGKTWSDDENSVGFRRVEHHRPNRFRESAAALVHLSSAPLPSLSALLPWYAGCCAAKSARIVHSMQPIDAKRNVMTHSPGQQLQIRPSDKIVESGRPFVKEHPANVSSFSTRVSWTGY